MGEALGNVYDVGEQDFEKKVVEESHTRPVVIDFWSQSCSPCMVLGPILEKVVESYDGRMALAKIQVEHHPRLAGAFGVQGVPAVIFDRRHLITGAQGVDNYASILKQLVEGEAA